jgi:hypothetical protein
MGIEEVELTGLDYIYKFSERLRIVLSKIDGCSDLTEEDFDVLAEMVRMDKANRLSLFKTICTDTAITTTEPTLFTE